MDARHWKYVQKYIVQVLALIWLQRGDRRDESDIALTYMNKNKNNFDAVFGLKPASPAAMNKKQQLQKENIAAAS